MWDEIEKKGKRYQELTALIESPEGPGSPSYSAWLRERGRMSKFGTIWVEFAAARWTEWRESFSPKTATTAW